VLYKQIVKKVW